MLKRSPLYEAHRQQNGLMIDFAGWEMPLHYGSQIAEHKAVREDVGIFDVSHMGIVDIEGIDTEKFLRYMLANNIDKLKSPGQALYSCLLNEKAGVVDDLIAYYLAPNVFRLVINAARIEADLAWLHEHQHHHDETFAVTITLRSDLGILAIQGPNAREKITALFPKLKEKILNLKSFQFFLAREDGSVVSDGNSALDYENIAITHENRMMVSCTGYTGEDGLEVILPKTVLKSFWNICIAAKIPPIGLGARDTLRLEAGLNLYGQDMDENVSPLESNLAWTVAFEPEDRDFIGRQALNFQHSQGIEKKLVGVILLDKGMLRHGQRLFKDGNCVGVITSGSFSPSLKKSIALARIHSNIQKDCLVEIRNQTLDVKIVKPPFVRRGHAKNTQGT